MSLPSPNLDDRSFDDLMAEAHQYIQLHAPGWTDRSPSDPGIVLIELFAFLTERMIYRLNQLPQKAYVAFLNLLGVSLQPPAAAHVDLVFSRERADDSAVEIPRGTRVTTSRTPGGEAPIFVTTATVEIQPGSTEVKVMAVACDQIDGELLGVGTGAGGLTLMVKHPPIVAPMRDQLDLIVGVEARPGEIEHQTAARRYQGKDYIIWQETQHYGNASPQDRQYVVDRRTGKIRFAPAVQQFKNGQLAEAAESLAALPAVNREIRAWYRSGGGPAGNVGANTLTTLKDPIPGLKVTNPNAAIGGRVAESLENALARGPQEIYSLQRAVTARDFETIALNTPNNLARARAFTRSALWKHAAAGAVEVLLVPSIPAEDRIDGQVSAEMLGARQDPEVCVQIQALLDERSALGTTAVVNWTRYKEVYVAARVAIGREEDAAAVLARVRNRLHQEISPLPSQANPHGWPFGRELRASDVYKIALSEPGVRWLDSVQLHVTDAPDKNVRALAADNFQPGTWYAGSGAALFRSTNDGASWERLHTFPGGTLTVLAPATKRAGLVAAVCHLDEGHSRIYLSDDAGESWQYKSALDFRVYDLDWAEQGQQPVLLVATEKGLYKLALWSGATLDPWLVDANNQDIGVYSVAVAADEGGVTSIVAALHDRGGVYLARSVGDPFEQLNLLNEDIRVLAIQRSNERTYLWAGTASAGGGDAGRGCFRWELRGRESPDGPQAHSAGWQGGSCLGIAFLDNEVLAATHRNGVLALTPSPNARWTEPDVSCGLPTVGQRFLPVRSLAAFARKVKTGSQASGIVMAGGDKGIYCRVKQSVEGDSASGHYRPASTLTYADKVPLPETWLFVSGNHDIQIVSEDEPI